MEEDYGYIKLAKKINIFAAKSDLEFDKLGQSTKKLL